MPLDDFRCVFMPYCIKRQEDGRYIVLNREYKPLGFLTREHVDYDQFPIAVTMKITKQTAKNLSAKDLSANESDDVSVIYLYNDGCVPTQSSSNMAVYLKKLEILAKLKVQ